eukprot:scaffold4250_cov247-Pinguiococcus_pyrenoidosus.AAC.3
MKQEDIECMKHQGNSGSKRRARLCDFGKRVRESVEVRVAHLLREHLTHFLSRSTAADQDGGHITARADDLDSLHFAIYVPNTRICEAEGWRERWRERRRCTDADLDGCRRRDPR